MPEYFTRDALFDEPTTTAQDITQKTGGMASNQTLRDAFAVAIISNPVMLWPLANSTVEAVAAKAYELADAMVAESLR